MRILAMPGATRCRDQVAALQQLCFLRFAFAAVAACVLVTPGLAAERNSSPYFVIRIVDELTGRGVPLVELETVNHVLHVSDSAGIVALDEPDLLGREIYFHVRSHGYEYPKDGFGYRGLKLVPRAGEEATIKMRRTNVAERLYRITGGGIYRDSVLAGLETPLREPLLNAQVLGQDTVIVTPYRWKLYWFWGDTDRASYPLGNFAATGATSELPARGGLPASAGVDLTYFTGPNGFAKQMCPNFGPGLHWIESLFTLPDEKGRERLVARISSQHGLTMPYAWHLALWNDEQEIFESKLRYASEDIHDAAHPFRASDGGTRYLYLYPNLRVRAELATALDPTRYEAFTCLAGDGKFRGLESKVERDAIGAARFTWKTGGDRLNRDRLKRLIDAGLLQPGESWLHARDFETGKPITARRGSVFWNEYRQRWIMITAPAAGEVWFGEAETPTGPWGYLRRVVAHTDYNFYNVTQHPFFDEDGGRQIYFEGTYTASFSAAKTKTPRYDYNQIMYRLSLDDPRLALPRPVFRTSTAHTPEMTLESREGATAVEKAKQVAFFALPPGRLRDGLVAVRQDSAGRLSVSDDPAGALFLAAALSSTVATPAEFSSSALVPLFEYRAASGARVVYSLEPQLTDPGLVRSAEPLCRVWTPHFSASFDPSRITPE